MLGKIYCVEDDTNIRELIVYTLSSVGFEAEGFECAEDFFKKTEEELPDLVLLDIMLPDTDGMEILKKLRADAPTSGLCVILLTAKSERMDKIRGLDMGADDYITKPFDVLELISRVKAHLRRLGNAASPVQIMTFSEISVDNNKRSVAVDGKEVSLTYKEYELLHMLMSAKGNVVSRESIISRIWDTDYEGESRTLDVHIRTLRQKLGAAGNHIETVRNVGYKIG